MAPPNKRAQAALAVMKAAGFSEAETKPTLRKLLKESDNNWDYIEDGNYSALVDAIFLRRESGPEEEEEVATPAAAVEPRHTRSRVKREEERPGLARQNSFIKKNVVAGPSYADEMSEEEPLVRYRRDKRPVGESPERAPCLRRPKLEPGEEGKDEPMPLAVIHPGAAEEQDHASIRRHLVRSAETTATSASATIDHVPVDGLSARNSHSILPSTKIDHVPAQRHPAISAYTAAPACTTNEQNLVPATLTRHVSTTAAAAASARIEQKLIPVTLTRNTPAAAVGTSSRKDQVSDGGNSERKASQPVDATQEHKEKKKGKRCLQLAASSNDTDHNLAHRSGESSLSKTDIASSSTGEVTILLNCARPNFQMPSMEYLLKVVEERCLRSYRISLKNVMKEVCDTAIELGYESDPNKRENGTPRFGTLRKPGLQYMPGCSSNGSAKLTLSHASGIPHINDSSPSQNFLENNENGRNGSMQAYNGQEAANNLSSSMTLIQQPLCLGGVRPPHDVNDVSKGEESVKIPLTSSGELPSSFFYIPKNLVHQNAYLNFSLARIGDEDCCSDCFGDCLAALIPCPCTRATGGEFAYTLDGRLTKKFLDECLSMLNTPEKHHSSFCKSSCPHERLKNEISPASCKGHLTRKFIKECWSKCGCYKQCGNRVVQRGITCKLEVFFTGERKGWGVRTINELPRGTFVCEYVGEILTNNELYDRTLQTTGNARHTYPVLLDADWGTEEVLKDEDALCLDATFYGNVARFINHRCSDANLIEVPVEVETPDRHYYHLAFFTTRKVEALEELTWDYGTDFDDHNHPIKAFTCRCQSKFCRGNKRSKRSAR